MTESSRTLGRIVAIAVVALLLGMGTVVFMLFRGETPSPVCDHVAELRKANAQDADEFVGAIVTYVAKRKPVSGGTPDARCRAAWRILDETHDEKEATRLFDCLMRASDARSARACLPG